MKEKLISSETIFKGHALSLRVDTIEKYSGPQSTREIVDHRDCIAVVVIDDDENVVMVRQFRRPADKTLLEIPAGSIEPGEQPEAGVKRELQEEIGFLPGDIKKIGGFYSAPGYCTEYLYLYVAKNLTESRLVAEDTDEIQVVKVPISKIPDMIRKGEICDAKSIAGLLQVIMERTNNE